MTASGGTGPEEPSRDLRLHSYSLLAVLGAGIFVAIAIILFAFTVLGMLTVRSGIAPLEFWLNPIVVTAIVLLGSAALSVGVFALVRIIAVKPMHAMLAALAELKNGNFDVRVKNSQPLTLKEIELFEESFNATAESLGKTELLRAGFVDDFSHEFNTPINSIAGFAELLQGERVSEEDRREYLGVIASESRRLSNMARSVLRLRQAESMSNLNSEELGEIAVAEELRRAVVLAADKWEAKDLAFELELQECSCVGSAPLLEHVWVNLVDNACKFSPDGGAVKLRLAEEGESLRLTVENDGPVISPEAQERLFDRFFQADSSHASAGCGLGLAMVKRVCSLHGAQIGVESTAQGHTTFTVRLPRTPG
ncbi:MAG: sensor histidine kinase [Coriobacteriales bacterium]